jgi:hypothetical protein
LGDSARRSPGRRITADAQITIATKIATGMIAATSGGSSGHTSASPTNTTPKKPMMIAPVVPMTPPPIAARAR